MWLQTYHRKLKIMTLLLGAVIAFVVMPSATVNTVIGVDVAGELNNSRLSCTIIFSKFMQNSGKYHGLCNYYPK